ncbi:MAG: hypothetical protein IT179_00730 [Acidobacteria bacterium]|nr:hypothetical protein [Acidobacteriota bacterium]
MKRRACVVAVLCLGVGLLAPREAAAQYADSPRTLAAVDQFVGTAAQVGRRLFIGGFFSRVSPPTGGAVVVDTAGAHVPGAFPRFDGPVETIVPDGLGGWVVVGGFTRVAGQLQAGLARVRPDRTVDPRYRLTTDGPIREVAIAHGRIYLAGSFTTINGARRSGLAALDAATGTLSSFAAGLDTGGRTVSALSISSIGVYASGWLGSGSGRLWGFDSASGAMLFEREAFVNAIAASSARVYVGGFGYERPVWAVDPRTGQEVPWSAGLEFQYLSGTYGDYTSIGALLLDGGRLYMGGYFRTADGQFSVAAVDAASGQPLSWRAESPAPHVGWMTRLGPALVAAGVAFDVGTGLRLPWRPQPFGGIAGVAPAPEGAVIVGDFNGIDGEARSNLASIDLDTGAIEPWSAALPQYSIVDRLDTDGTFLFAITREGRFQKIDPATGAVLGSLDFGNDVSLVRHRIANGRIIVAVVHSVAPAEVAAITIADWSRQALPISLGGPLGNYVSGLDVAGDTLYVAGPFGTVNGVARPYLAAVDMNTGAVLPFDASPEALVNNVRLWGGRLVAAGLFRRIGGQRRRGLAELDPVTGRATDWNPDVPGGAQMETGPDGLLYVAPATSISGQAVRDRLVGLSPPSLRPVPWRPALDGFVLVDWLSFTPDCFVPRDSTVKCHPAALPSPSLPAITQAGAGVTLTWSLPAGPPAWTGVRVEVGRTEGASDVATFALTADATSISGGVPPGTYFARVRTTGPRSTSHSTEDVSFTVGPPDVPAPALDATAVTEGTALTFRWRPPSTGAPPAYVLEAGTAEGLSDVAQLPLGGGATSFTIDAPPGRYWGRIRAVNAAGASAPSGELLIDVDATDSPCYSVPPLAPANLAASVAGGAVTLTWEQPDAGPVPNTQRVVAGTAPGLDNLGAIGVPGPATSFTTTAPPGTYYVRVIGLNSCGASPYSNEVGVEVP